MELIQTEDVVRTNLPWQHYVGDMMPVYNSRGRQVKLICERIIDGAGPSERIVVVATSSGTSEEVVVPHNVVHENLLEVSRIGQSDGSVLVELPQESTSGNWRIWVPGSALVPA